MDEDVGKVAQATPILICTTLRFNCSKTGYQLLQNDRNVNISDRGSKVTFRGTQLLTDTILFYFLIYIAKALELFMQSLIDEACMETRAKNAKRLTAAHL